MALLYDRILTHRKIIVNKKDTVWIWAFNTPCKSLKSILVLFEEEGLYTRDTSKFYNPKIQKVSVIVEGKPNQLYTQEMRSFEQYDEICQYFAERKQRDNPRGVLPYQEVGGLGPWFSQVHQIRGKIWGVLSLQDTKIGKESQFWQHLALYLKFKGQIWGICHLYFWRQNLGL